MGDYTTVGSWIGLKPRRASSRTSALGGEANIRPSTMFTEEVFQNVLRLERRRAERSSRPFILVLVHSDKGRPCCPPTSSFRSIISYAGI